MIKLEEQVRHFWYLLNETRKKHSPLRGHSNKDCVYLFGVPKYMNYGDLAITEAEKQFLHKHFPQREVISLSESRTDVQLEYLKDHISKNDIIAINGGGNMDDMYPFQDKMRGKIFSTFPNNRIVSFPQSVNYNLEKSDSSFYKLKDTLLKTTNTHLFVRDKASFDFLSSNVPKNVNVSLTPDIVLSLDFKKSVERNSIITTFLRSDNEKLKDPKISELVDKLDKHYTVVAKDTSEPYWMHIVTNNNIKKLVNNKLCEFASSKLVITDRLHGMIFSVVTGTPAIVFDNSNHKIKHAYKDWLSDVPYIYFADENSNLNEIADRIMKSEPGENTPPNFESEYRSLVDVFTL